jgi:hypothetical protein
MSYRYLTYFKSTNNNDSFQINIPLDIDLSNSRFAVSSILGKMTTDNNVVYVHSPELTTAGSWNSINERADTLYSCILGSNVTKPVDNFISSQDIGFVTPPSLAQNRRVTLQFRDINGDLIADSNIDYIVTSITFFSIGPQQSTTPNQYLPLYNYN